MSKKTKEKDDFWGEAGNVNFPYFKFEEIGDKVKGVYVGKFKSRSKYGYEQMNYILIKKDGSKIVVSGRSYSVKGDKQSMRIMYGMDKIPLGGVIGFIYEDNLDTGMDNEAKIINLKYVGEVNKEVAKKFASKFNLEEVAEEAAAGESGSGKSKKSKAHEDIDFDDEESEDEEEAEEEEEEEVEEEEEEEEEGKEEDDEDLEEEESEDDEEEEEEEVEEEDEEEEEEEAPKKKVSKKLKSKKSRR